MRVSIIRKLVYDRAMTHLPIIVVGAGIVGASTALALQEDGHTVTLLDREEPCAGASFGNAGVIVNGSCVPTAMPGIALTGLRMLVDANAPMSIRAAYVPKILPWLVRFVLESRASRVASNTQAIHALSKDATSCWLRLIGNTGLREGLASGGWLRVFETEKAFVASRTARSLMDDVGTPYAVLNAAEIQEMEPHLAPNFCRAIFQEDSMRITNPFRMVQGMVELFVARGGTYQRFEVNSIVNHQDAGTESITLTNAHASLFASKVVIACGAWSRTLAKQMGDIIPLDTERGYHLMFSPEDSALLNRAVVHSEASFVLSPMEAGLRMTSQVEFAGVDAPADYRHIRSLVPAAKRMLPELESNEQSVWMGCRPSLPDSLPVLGFSSRSDKVLYAFGHQHLGMTLGPRTAFIIADLIAGRSPDLEMAPYRPRS